MSIERIKSPRRSSQPFQTSAAYRNPSGGPVAAPELIPAGMTKLSNSHDYPAYAEIPHEKTAAQRNAQCNGCGACDGAVSRRHAA